MERQISDMILELADGKPQFVRAYRWLVDGLWCMPDFAFRYDFGFNTGGRNVIRITRLAGFARLGGFIGIASAVVSSGSRGRPAQARARHRPCHVAWACARARRGLRARPSARASPGARALYNARSRPVTGTHPGARRRPSPVVVWRASDTVRIQATTLPVFSVVVEGRPGYAFRACAASARTREAVTVKSPAGGHRQVPGGRAGRGDGERDG